MSLWWDQVNRPIFMPEDLDQSWDVIIVGGGFSGLWTAHHLNLIDATLKIAILEKGQVGSGASGRNGGWVSALYPMADAKLHKFFSQSKIDELHAHLSISIDDIGTFAKLESIDIGFNKGGSLVVARNHGQLTRLRGERIRDARLLDKEETKARIGMKGAVGSRYSADCATINPAALVVGLAKSLEKRGVSIFENTFADITKRNRVHARGKELKTAFLVRAVEAYYEKTREQIPIYSLMIATEPLPSTVFDDIGIQNREAFAEGSHLVTYAQRTPDNRLAIGGRGAPYTWGSRRNEANENLAKGHQRLRAMASKWFPVLNEYEFTHAWGGAVAVTRDWAPYVRMDNSYGELGGYAGDGLTLSYLAAGAMADLITDRKSTRSTLPFVQWRNPRWESEPLRWIAVNAAIKLSGVADKEERITRRPSVIMKTLSPITGQ